MKYECPLLVVSDMSVSKEFYSKVFGLKVVSDLGANVSFDCGFALQTKDSWASFLNVPERMIIFGNLDSEIYFEEDEFDEFVKKLETMDIKYVHRVIEHPWGQRAVRIYDPDMHVIEVGENLSTVCIRFMNSGMTIEEAAERMGIPLQYAIELTK